MERNDFTIESQFDGLEIKVVVMVPDTQVRGVVQFAHGMAEHKERYFDFMKYLAAFPLIYHRLLIFEVEFRKPVVVTEICAL